MTEKEFILKLLDMNQPMSNTPIRFSTIVLLLKGGRKLFGCDLETGEYQMNELNEENILDQTYHSFQFSGLINYLILLEQIGSIFKPINATSIKKTNGIFCALKFFSQLSDEKIKAIISLRNSLTHRFGLATEKKPSVKPPRKFILSIERDKEIVKLPNIDWDGTFSDKSDSTNTTIFIIDLVDQIEKIYKEVSTKLINNNLDIIPIGGIDEIKARYTIIY
jgi:hypothetical protein